MNVIHKSWSFFQNRLPELFSTFAPDGRNRNDKTPVHTYVRIEYVYRMMTYKRRCFLSFLHVNVIYRAVYRHT